MVLATFTPSALFTVFGTASSQNIGLPATGTPKTALIANVGNTPASVWIGTSAVAITAATSLTVLPGQSIARAITSGQYLAYQNQGAVGATILSVTVGS